MSNLSLWQIDAWAYDDGWGYNDKFQLLDFVGQADSADEAAQVFKEELKFLNFILECDTEVVPCPLGYEMVRKDNDRPLFLLEIH